MDGLLKTEQNIKLSNNKTLIVRLSELSPGVYIIRIFDKQEIRSLKFIKG